MCTCGPSCYEISRTIDPISSSQVTQHFTSIPASTGPALYPITTYICASWVLLVFQGIQHVENHVFSARMPCRFFNKASVTSFHQVANLTEMLFFFNISRIVNSLGLTLSLSVYFFDCLNCYTLYLHNCWDNFIPQWYTLRPQGKLASCSIASFPQIDTSIL